jgi:hypothetical protein
MPAGGREGRAYTDLFGFDAAEPPAACVVKARERSEEAWADMAAQPRGGPLAKPRNARSAAELQQLVQKNGICPSRRRELWMEWSGAGALKEARPAGYASLVLQAAQARGQPGHALAAQFEQVEIDLERTYPENMFFVKPEARPWAGGDALRRVLTAFVVDSPEVGYTQSMNYIAAFMLLVTEVHRPPPAADEAQAAAQLEDAEEDAFWLTYALCRRAIAGYHCSDLAGLRTDLEVFNTLVQLKLPRVSACLKEAGFDDLGFIVSRWYLCCFFGVLPAEAAARVMDLFFLANDGANVREGPTVLFRVGLALLKWVEPQIVEAGAEDRSIEACMLIQGAGKEIRTAGELDILLFTAQARRGPGAGAPSPCGLLCFARKSLQKPERLAGEMWP